MSKKEKILLSADGDIALYEVNKEILDNFDEIIKKFFLWKKTNIYDETLFVKFLKNRFGEDSINYVKIVGVCEGNAQYTREHKIDEEYKNEFWYNF